MNIVSVYRNSDRLGIIASSLCLVHCLATPLLLIASTTTVVAHETHSVWWWGFLDVVFLSISFIAIYWSAKTTSDIKIKYAFWVIWSFLSVIIINEKLGLLSLPEFLIYPITISLVILHFYNQKYCRCKGKECCKTYESK